MIIFKKVKDIHGDSYDFSIESEENHAIQADHLVALPAVIDPHVHFRTPGLEHKEDWRTGAKAALSGGCTMVFDMPNTLPPTFTHDLLRDKKALIDSQLKEVNLPLRYNLFFGADKHHLSEIPGIKESVIGIKVFMGCSTGNLVIDDDESLAAVFEMAAKENLLVAVHAEDEHLIRERKKNYKGPMHYAAHSHLRDIEVATRAVEKAINLSKKYGTRLYILHVSSKDEVALVKQAKANQLPVYAETTPHHLFFDTSAYDTLKGRAVVNPPLRDSEHREVLLEAIREGVIDTIGSDHAPHTISEKDQPYGQCPSGMPGIEFMLPLLLDAHAKGHLTLQQIVNLTSHNAKNIFNLPIYQDWVLVDLNKISKVHTTHSKCGWTPYMGKELTGWPVFTVSQGRLFKDLN